MSVHLPVLPLRGVYQPKEVAESLLHDRPDLDPYAVASWLDRLRSAKADLIIRARWGLRRHRPPYQHPLSLGPEQVIRGMRSIRKYLAPEACFRRGAIYARVHPVMRFGPESIEFDLLVEVTHAGAVTARRYDRKKGPIHPQCKNEEGWARACMGPSQGPNPEGVPERGPVWSPRERPSPYSRRTIRMTMLPVWPCGANPSSVLTAAETQSSPESGPVTIVGV